MIARTARTWRFEPCAAWALPLLALAPAMSAAQALPLATANSGELGIMLSGYAYEEKSNGSSSTQDGNKLGISAAFTQALQNGWFWGGDARQSHGNVSYSSASSGSKGSNPDIVTEARLTLGRDFQVGRQVLAPYAGLGYRTLYTDLRGTTTTGDQGYRRSGQYTYLPLGVTHRAHVNPEARFSTSLEYDLLLEGRQLTYLSDANPASNDPVNTQRQGYGLRVTGNYETSAWSFGGYLHYWSLADSDAALRTLNGASSYLYTVPQNTTREIGLQLKLRFN